MKRSRTVFFRSVRLTAVIVLCLLLGGYGTAKAYESIRQTAFGEYCAAVELTADGLRILDFVIPFRAP